MNEENSYNERVRIKKYALSIIIITLSRKFLSKLCISNHARLESFGQFCPRGLGLSILQPVLNYGSETVIWILTDCFDGVQCTG